MHFTNLRLHYFLETYYDATINTKLSECRKYLKSFDIFDFNTLFWHNYYMPIWFKSDELQLDKRALKAVEKATIESYKSLIELSNNEINNKSMQEIFKDISNYHIYSLPIIENMLEFKVNLSTVNAISLNKLFVLTTKTPLESIFKQNYYKGKLHRETIDKMMTFRLQDFHQISSINNETLNRKDSVLVLLSFHQLFDFLTNRTTLNKTEQIVKNQIEKMEHKSILKILKMYGIPLEGHPLIFIQENLFEQNLNIIKEKLNLTSPMLAVMQRTDYKHLITIFESRYSIKDTLYDLPKYLKTYELSFLTLPFGSFKFIEAKASNTEEITILDVLSNKNANRTTTSNIIVRYIGNAQPNNKTLLPMFIKMIEKRSLNSFLQRPDEKYGGYTTAQAMVRIYEGVYQLIYLYISYKCFIN